MSVQSFGPIDGTDHDEVGEAIARARAEAPPVEAIVIPARMSFEDCARNAEASHQRRAEMEREQRIIGGVVGYNRFIDPDAFPGFPPYYVRQPYPPPRFELDYVAAASQVPIVHACVARISQDLASLPMRFYRGGKDDREEILPERGNVAYLWKHPNKVDTDYTLMRALSTSLEITGNSALFIDTFKSDPFAPTPLWELWSMPGHVVKVCVDERRRPVAYEWLGGIAPVLLEADQVIYFQHLSPNFEPRGMSPLEPARLSYETRFLMAVWHKEFYAKGAQVAGLWSIKAEGGRTLSEPDAKAMKEKLRRLNSGPKWAYDPVIVQNLEYVRAGLSQKDMNYTETTEMCDADICRAFGIPPVVMGIKVGGGLSDAGSKADMMLYFENCLMPRAKMIEAMVTARLCNRWGEDVSCELSFKNVLAMQSALLDQMKSAVIGAGRPVYDVNELRQVSGYDERTDPDEKADSLFTPAMIDVGRPSAGGMNAGGALDGKPPEDVATPPSTTGATPQDKVAAAAAARRVQARRATQRRRGQAGVETYRRRFAREFVRILNGQEHRVLHRLKNEFELKGIALDAAANSNGKALNLKRLDLTGVIDENDNIDVEALEAMFHRVVTERGEEQLAELGVEIEIALNNARAQHFIQRSAHEVLDYVNATTGKNLRSEFADIAARNGTYADYVGAVNAVFDGRRATATNIARTEMTGAYNFANVNAARSSGVATAKVWLTAEDELVREAHSEAEAQGPIGLEESWVLEGNDGPVEMAFPGDPDAPPELRCNCRCTTAFENADMEDVERAARPSPEMRAWFREASKAEVVS